jgi:hypothetical protein
LAYVPVLGGKAAADFPLQFPRASISGVSMACTMVCLLSNDGLDNTVSHGSGFFWRHAGNVFLITARHVLSGLSPFDDLPISSSAYFPSKIRIYPMMAVEDGAEWARCWLDVDLNRRAWLQDPHFEQLRTDIAALQIDFESPSKVRCLNDVDMGERKLYAGVGLECAVVGYPTHNFAATMMPIWRSGSIASEPLLPIDDKPMFLIDVSTGPGFSGAPVFRKHVGPAPELCPDGSIETKVDSVFRVDLVGVYAGRFAHKHLGCELPFVFYANRLPFILGS